MRLVSLLSVVMLLLGISFFSPVVTLATSGPVVDNPGSTSVLVNKTYQLPSDYVPESLVTPDVPFAGGEAEQLRPVAANALESLISDANQAGITIKAASGYRSYNYQLNLHQYYVNQYGEEYASQISAEAGHSEHQTGLAMDVTTPAVNDQLTESFANTAAGQWVKENAETYGFIIRYPEGKENITGYSYEPWHLRYVGTEIASYIMNNQLTLDEYMSGNGDSDSSQTYTVQPGDTFWGISRQFDGVTVQDLQEWNPNIDPYYLSIGTELYVEQPDSGNGDAGTTTYTVQPGDTLWEIAQGYEGVTVNDLVNANPGINPDLISIGQTIVIPTESQNGDNSSGMRTYTVQSGDTFWAIARMYDSVSTQDLLDANPSVNPRLLSVGSEINIPQ